MLCLEPLNYKLIELISKSIFEHNIETLAKFVPLVSILLTQNYYFYVNLLDIGRFDLELSDS